AALFRLSILLILVALLSLPGGFIGADEVHLINRHCLRGRILSDDGKQVVLQVPEGKIWIRKSRISSILKLEPEKTLLDECNRRIQGGTPGSAIPFLRKEYRQSPLRDQILPIYRESLLCEIERQLELEKMERVLELWKEYQTLAGTSSRDGLIREKIFQGQERLLNLESNIHIALEMDQPLQATSCIRNLLAEFPSEHRKWNTTLAENLLEAGRRAYDRGDLEKAAPLLIDSVILLPHQLHRARTAIVYCATRGHGLTIDQAQQLLPRQPAVFLAAAKNAEKYGNGFDRASQLDRVRELVGEEINPVEIATQLSTRAHEELAGAPSAALDINSHIDQHHARMWRQWNLPGKPPAAIGLRIHDNSEQMNEILGPGSAPVRLTVEMNYGQLISETLHMVVEDPFLDQDALPRELFRNTLVKIVGSSCWLPPWLEEGMCAISRGELARRRDLHLLKDAYNLGNLPDITDLLEMKASAVDELYRATCGSLVEWLITDVPPALLPDLLLRWSEEGLEQSLSTVTGADTLHELQQDWIRGSIKSH
ncbi:MAG: hypothetical protein AAEJ47_06365, partial [Planctomycetota bacterium]